MEPKRESRITVLLTQKEAESFDTYCRQNGFKKSTLIVKLIREHLERNGFAYQTGPTLETENDDR